MKLPATRTESVACIRFEAPPGSGKFIGCGKGWTQPARSPTSHPDVSAQRCPDCGRPLLRTGSYLEAKLPGAH